MKVLIVEPDKLPYLKDIRQDLSTYREIVGGSIQCTYPFEDMVGLVCNDEGKLEGLPLNRALRTRDGNIYDIVAGTFFIAFDNLFLCRLQKQRRLQIPQSRLL